MADTTTEVRHIDPETQIETVAFIGTCYKCKKEAILIQQTDENWRNTSGLDARDLTSFCWRHVIIRQGD